MPPVEPPPRRRPPWAPSAKKLAFDWYFDRVVKILGAGLVIWEIIWDHGKNPLTLLLGVMLAGSTNYLDVIKRLAATGRLERKELEKLLGDEEEQPESGPEEGDA